MPLGLCGPSLCCHGEKLMEKELPREFEFTLGNGEVCDALEGCVSPAPPAKQVSYVSGPYGPIRAHMGPYGPLWALMGP